MKMHKEAVVITIPYVEWQEVRRKLIPLIKGWRDIDDDSVKTYIGYYNTIFSEAYNDIGEDKHMLLEDFDIFHEACESLYKIQKSGGKNVQAIWEGIDGKLQELRNNYIDND